MSILRITSLVGSLLFLLAVMGEEAAHAATTARPGATIPLAVGWKARLARQDVSVTITPSTGGPVVHGPDAPLVRAVVNLYPDPVSRMMVEPRATRDGAGAMRAPDQDVSTGNDWWITVVYVTLPDALPAGTATIEIAGRDGVAISEPFVVEVVGDTASAPPTDRDLSGDPATDLALLERAAHSVVTFAGRTVPHSIQLDLHHRTGAAAAWVVNPHPDTKNLVWSDNGSTLRVLLTPVHGQTLSSLEDFTFYVAGGLPDLTVDSVRAYDVDGAVMPDVTVSLQ
jgi:hypothetical protein